MAALYILAVPLGIILGAVLGLTYRPKHQRKAPHQSMYR